MLFRSLQLSATVYTPEYRPHRSSGLSEVTIALYFYEFRDYNCVEKGMLVSMTLVVCCHSELDPFKLMLMKLYFKGTVLIMIALMVIDTRDILSN